MKGEMRTGAGAVVDSAGGPAVEGGVAGEVEDAGRCGAHDFAHGARVREALDYPADLFSDSSRGQKYERMILTALNALTQTCVCIKEECVLIIKIHMIQKNCNYSIS